MWIREADQYECELSADTQRIAKLELREDQRTRDQALASMRDWIKKNPRIVNCRLDANFLLRFLRAKKFSCPMAQEALERYLLLRKTYGPAFRNLDITDPVLDRLVTDGYIFAVPKRDHLGRRIIIARPGVFDPYKNSNVDMTRVHGMTYETLMESEESQVRGYVHFADGANVSFPILTLFTPREAVRIVKNGERTLPMRHKEAHIINVPQALKFAVDFGLSLISEKIRKRVKFYTCLEDCLQHVDRSLLPREYGGDMPMAEMIELWKQECLVARETLLSHDLMDIRVELFSDQARQGAVSALKNGSSCFGSFRQLEVD